MWLPLLTALLAASLAGCRADIVEHFEGGMGDVWKTWTDDNGGHWVWGNASTLDIPPRPAGQEGVTMVIPDEGRPSAAAHLYSPLIAFPAGAKVKLTFWIRSKYIGSANLILKLVEGGQEDKPFLDLSHFSTPGNDKWAEAEAEVPSSSFAQTRICVFGYHRNSPEDAIAVDDLVLTGVDGSEASLPMRPH